MLARSAGRDSEAGQLNGGAAAVYQDVGRPHVLVDEASPVYLVEYPCERNGDTEEFGHIHRVAEQVIERVAAWILEHQRRSTIATRECDGPRGPVGLEHSPQTVFMLDSPEGIVCCVLRAGDDQQDRVETFAGAAIEAQLAFP